jgi:hypothetical protein
MYTGMMLIVADCVFEVASLLQVNVKTVLPLICTQVLPFISVLGIVGVVVLTKLPTPVTEQLVELPPFHTKLINPPLRTPDVPAFEVIEILVCVGSTMQSAWL